MVYKNFFDHLIAIKFSEFSSFHRNLVSVQDCFVGLASQGRFARLHRGTIQFQF